MCFDVYFSEYISFYVKILLSPSFKHKITMDPYEIEFIAENRTISIIPNFTYDKIYLICGEFGPFRAGLPMNVPLWLGVMLKQKQKCRIVPPEWMVIDTLENIKEEEKRSRYASVLLFNPVLVFRTLVYRFSYIH